MLVQPFKFFRYSEENIYKQRAFQSFIAFLTKIEIFHLNLESEAEALVGGRGPYMFAPLTGCETA